DGAELEVVAVQRVEEVELFLLLGAGQGWMAKVGQELLDSHVVGVNGHALMRARQEGAGPQLRADHGSARSQNNEGRQVVILAAEPVGKPRSERRPGRLLHAGVHENQAGLMVRHVCVHRTNDAEIVSALSEARKQFAQHDTASAVWVEFERRRRIARLGSAEELLGRLLARIFLQCWLWIKGINMGWAAVHEQEDYSLRFGCEVGMRRKR